MFCITCILPCWRQSWWHCVTWHFDYVFGFPITHMRQSHLTHKPGASSSGLAGRCATPQVFVKAVGITYGWGRGMMWHWNLWCMISCWSLDLWKRCHWLFGSVVKAYAGWRFHVAASHIWVLQPIAVMHSIHMETPAGGSCKWETQFVQEHVLWFWLRFVALYRSLWNSL